MYPVELVIEKYNLEISIHTIKDPQVLKYLLYTIFNTQGTEVFKHISSENFHTFFSIAKR